MLPEKSYWSLDTEVKTVAKWSALMITTEGDVYSKTVHVNNQNDQPARPLGITG